MRVSGFYHSLGGQPSLIGPYLPRRFFLKMHESMPILCVDMVPAQSSEAKWFASIPKGVHSCVKSALQSAGF